MRIQSFVEEIMLKDCTNQTEEALYLCYFNEIENQIKEHSIDNIMAYFEQAGFHKPNKSRLLQSIKSNKKFTKSGNRFGIHAKTKSELGSQLSEWFNIVKLPQTNDVVNDVDFKSNRTLQDMVIEMNAAYRFGIYNGCEVLMRRVFENLLILAYEKNGIASEIQSNGQYKDLGQIIKNAETNVTLNLSRSKYDYVGMVNIFNTSAHNRYYLATKKSVDNIKHSYAVAIAELLHKARFI